MELKCNSCKHLTDTSFCSYLDEHLLNAFAKLHYGGAIAIYCGEYRYVGRCGSGFEPKEQTEMTILPIIETATAITKTSKNSIGKSNSINSKIENPNNKEF